MIGDFNAKSSNGSPNNTTTAEGTQIDYLTLLYGMKQFITEPTHLSENSSCCIDPDSTVHPTRYSKCHHQIIYSKVNLKTEY